jgi:hypothetical protein
MNKCLSQGTPVSKDAKRLSINSVCWTQETYGSVSKVLIDDEAKIILEVVP